MIIDSHTHVFPPEIIERRDVFVKRDNSFAFIYENPKARMVAYDELIAEMDSAGVAVSIVCGFPWKSIDMCRHHNDYMIEAVEGASRQAGRAGDREPGGGQRVRS